MKIKRTCLICGKEFFVDPHKVKSGYGKYCSQKCYGLSRRGYRPGWEDIRIKCNCKTCGKEFFVKPSVIKKGGGKYCSQKCYFKTKGSVIKCTCQICGKEFKTNLYNIGRGWGKFCSKECANIAKSGKNSSTWKGGKKERLCQECGKVFYVLQSSGAKYCSNECKHLAKDTKIKCTCLTCGKEFETKPSRLKNGYGKYCSRECYGISKRVDKIKCTCRTCGGEFYKYPSEIKSDGDKYCSKECYDKSRFGETNPRWNGGTSFLPYCIKFNERRKKAVRDFFSHVCLVCGADEIEFRASLSVHHIDHDRDQGCGGKPFNLITLCASCHSKETRREEEYRIYINKTLDEGFKWGIWNKEEYELKVMYPDD